MLEPARSRICAGRDFTEKRINCSNQGRFVQVIRVGITALNQINSSMNCKWKNINLTPLTVKSIPVPDTGEESRMITHLLMLTMFCLTGGAQGQLPSWAGTTAVGGLYDEVPAAERESMKVAIDALIALQKAGKWEEVYKWLDNEEQITREEFIKRRKNICLVEFIPCKIYFFPPAGYWSIEGCATFSPIPPILKGRSGGVLCCFRAKRTGDGWRFSAPPLIILSKDFKWKIQPCSNSK